VWRRYKRTQIAEMADWEPGFPMDSVSISEPDAAAGSPKAGDKIARNPANHDDRWLVSAAYFAANFEPESPCGKIFPWPVRDEVVKFCARERGHVGAHQAETGEVWVYRDD
jgi:hypothetical protein